MRGSIVARCVAALLIAGLGCGVEDERASECGDGVVEGVESCEPPGDGCSDACQRSGELVASVTLPWSCHPVDLELLAGAEPVVLCGSDPVFVVRFDALGGVLWLEDWDEPDGASTSPVALAVGGRDERATIVAMGDAEFTNARLGYRFPYAWVRRHHEDGALVWQRNFRQGFAQARGVCVDVEGEVYVAYSTAEPLVTIERLDSLTGETIWRRSWTATWWDADLACAAEGPVVASELREGSQALGVELRAFDREGELRWPAEPDVARVGGLRAGADGEVILAGVVARPGSEYVPVALRFDRDGAPLLRWEADAPGEVRAVAVDGSGDVYVYAVDDPYDEPTKTVTVYQLARDGTSGWAYTAAGAFNQGGIAAGDRGRVVFFEPRAGAVGFELVWVGQ